MNPKLEYVAQARSGAGHAADLRFAERISPNIREQEAWAGWMKRWRALPAEQQSRIVARFASEAEFWTAQKRLLGQK